MKVASLCSSDRSRASIRPILSAKISSPVVVDHAAAVAVAVEAQRQVGAVLADGLGHVVQHLAGLRGSDCSCGKVQSRSQSISITSATPIRRRASGAKAPAVPLPQAATTFSGRFELHARRDVGDVALGDARRRR